MDLQRILLTPKQLRNIPSQERALLLVLAHALNEINTLNKLLFLSTNFESEPKWHAHAHASQALILARTLVGKLSEAWTVVQDGYFGTKLSQTHSLDESAIAAMSNLKSYFGRKSIVNSVRNNFAFHYSLDHAKVEIPNDVLPDELAIYLHSSNGNSFYLFAELVMNKALMDSIDPKDPEVAIDRLFAEMSSVVDWLNDFAQGVIFSILDMRIGADVLRQSNKLINIGPVPKSSDIRIPYFIEISSENAKSEKYE